MTSRRRLMVQAFRDMGLELLRAAGRVLRVPRHSEDRPDQRGLLHSAFCARKKVVCVPGTAFGQSGEGLHPLQLRHRRLLKLTEALDRMKRDLDRLCPVIPF